MEGRTALVTGGAGFVGASLVREALRAVEVDLTLGAGSTAALIATLETPRGRVELR